jgi:hypothetical protein
MPTRIATEGSASRPPASQPASQPPLHERSKHGKHWWWGHSALARVGGEEKKLESFQDRGQGAGCVTGFSTNGRMRMLVGFGVWKLGI